MSHYVFRKKNTDRKSDEIYLFIYIYTQTYIYMYAGIGIENLWRDLWETQ